MFRLFIVLLFAISVALSATENQSNDIPYWQASSVEKHANKISKKTVKSSTQAATDNTNLQLTAQQRQHAKSLNQQQQNGHTQDHLIWVYDAWLVLREDRDHDQYYQSFEVTFDVDTSLEHADVYARLYLGDGNVYREFHTTSVFHIDALDVEDEFVVTTDLLEGFQSYDYDILIEVYDASDDRLEDSYDHTDDADLSLIPLESREYEYSGGTGSSAPVSISHEHGGSAGLTLMVLLLTALALKVFQPRITPRRSSMPNR